MNIVPLLHRIIVKPENLEDFSKEHKYAKKIGIVIPEMEEMKRAQAGVDRGVVVAIGPTAFRDFNVEVPVQVGDVVNYARFSGKLIEDHETEEKFIILNDEDLICILKD